MSEVAPENHNNPGMLSEEQARAENPFIRGEAGERIEERRAPFSRPDFARKEETKRQEILKEKEKATADDHPLKFKGSYGGGTIRTKLFSFVVGRKSGRKDFKAFRAKRGVINELKELKDDFTYKSGRNYIRKSTAKMEATKLWRKLPYLRGDEHTAAVKFLEELKDKTGIEPRK